MRAGPSQTAHAVCYFRAQERRRPEGERIVDDPFAERFLTRAARAGLGVQVDRIWDAADALAMGLSTFALARHRLLDDWLRAALAGSELRQVVLLGAGYDSRAWRMSAELGGRPLFEVDHPATGERKTRCVGSWKGDWPASDRRVVAVDFEREDFACALAAAGFDPALPTFWTWEGVSMYLHEDAIRRTLAAVSSHSAPGSRLAMDWTLPLDVPGFRPWLVRRGARALSLLGEPIRSGLDPERADAFLAPHGMSVLERVAAGDLLRRLQREDRAVTLPGWCSLIEVGGFPQS